MASSLLKIVLTAALAAGLTGCGSNKDSTTDGAAGAKPPSNTPPPISGDMPPAPKSSG